MHGKRASRDFKISKRGEALEEGKREEGKKADGKAGEEQDGWGRAGGRMRKGPGDLPRRLR
jgi:hypothetical protein